MASPFYLGYSYASDSDQLLPWQAITTRRRLVQDAPSVQPSLTFSPFPTYSRLGSHHLLALAPTALAAVQTVMETEAEAVAGEEEEEEEEEEVAVVLLVVVVVVDTQEAA